MSYRAPRYCHVHAIRDVGAAAITVSDTADPDFPKTNLVDDRAQTRFMWDASYSTPYIDVNLGSGFDTGIDRLIIPADHNLTFVRVGQDDNSGFSSINYLMANTAVTPGTLIAIDLTDSSERYLRIFVNGTGQFYLTQLIYTKIVTIDRGVALADSPDFFKANATRLEQSTGQSPTIQHGPQQRVIEYNYESPLSGTDLAKMKALVADVGMHRPFWVDPHSFAADPDADDPPIWMKFLEMPRSRNSILVPMSGTESKVYPVSLIESLD